MLEPRSTIYILLVCILLCVAGGTGVGHVVDVCPQASIATGSHTHREPANREPVCGTSIRYFFSRIFGSSIPSPLCQPLDL